MLIDTHIHLYAEEFSADREALIAKARRLGVDHFFLPNIDAGSVPAMLDLESRHPGLCHAMMGLHPCSVTANVAEELRAVREWLDRRKFAAIGEIGIDLYWDKTFAAQQELAFRTQAEWAVEFGYPIVIHTRNSFAEVMAVLQSLEKRPTGIFHCFSGTVAEAEQVLAIGGFKLGIGGVVTFKNSGLDKVVEAIDLGHMVLETDAPYLAPVPFRGKRNEPAYIVEVARRIAVLKNTDLDEVAEITSKNALSLFGTP
jgi:TatD DNase family protein